MRLLFLMPLLFLCCCEQQNDIKSVEGLFVIEEIFMNDVIRSGILSDSQIKDVKLKDKEIWDGINLAKEISKTDPEKSKKILDDTKTNIEILSKELNQSK